MYYTERERSTSFMELITLVGKKAFLRTSSWKISHNNSWLIKNAW